jgi:hypothetical protein
MVKENWSGNACLVNGWIGIVVAFMGGALDNFFAD